MPKAESKRRPKKSGKSKKSTSASGKAKKASKKPKSAIALAPLKRAIVANIPSSSLFKGDARVSGLALHIYSNHVESMIVRIGRQALEIAMSGKRKTILMRDINYQLDNDCNAFAGTKMGYDAVEPTVARPGRVLSILKKNLPKDTRYSKPAVELIARIVEVEVAAIGKRAGAILGAMKKTTCKERIARASLA